MSTLYKTAVFVYDNKAADSLIHSSKAAEATHISESESGVERGLTACYSAQPAHQTHKNAITDELARFRCKDRQLICVFWGKGSKDVRTELDPQYHKIRCKISSCSTISLNIRMILKGIYVCWVEVEVGWHIRIHSKNCLFTSNSLNIYHSY